MGPRRTGGSCQHDGYQSLLEILRRVFERDQDSKREIVEPVLGTCRGILPKPDSLAGVRRSTTNFQVVLIAHRQSQNQSFRCCPRGPLNCSKVTPDLATFT